MAEPRKIVLILGNGFDLDLNLKTRYQDFWESDFCPKDYPAPLIHHLNQCWPDNRDAVKWYDLENELMKYYMDMASPYDPKDFITDEEKEFLTIFEPYKWDYGMYNDKVDVVQSLVDKRVILVANKVIRQLYVPYKEDLSQSPVWRDRMALQLIKEGLCKYLEALKYEREARDTVAYQVLQFLAVEGEEKCSVAIYSFNYTNVKHFVYSAKDTIPIICTVAAVMAKS
ncbi:MAG: bacteriophage abortive infection AbiH family protein [Bacteroidales bacterium]|nr:bacteriophage abortive infection AbiH family protein [Bacteroidales bacterium]